MVKTLILALTTLLFFLLPWYYTDSGQPQPVDIAIITLIGIFCCLKLPYLTQLVRKAPIFNAFILFAIYTIVVLLTSYILDQYDITLRLILQNVYYLALLSLFLLLITYLATRYPPEKYYRLILWFLLIDTIIPFYCLLQHGGIAAREGLSFNNPNQLGFYVLVNFSIFFYATLLATQQRIPIHKLLSLLIININVVFLFASASRACYPVILLYVFSYLYIFRIKMQGYGALLVKFMAALVVGIGAYLASHTFYAHMQTTRLTNLPTNTTGLSHDIYFRGIRGITENFSDIRYFFLGNGTYTTAVRGTLEFHNNFLGILNQVGLIGCLFYIYLNWLLFKALYRKGFLYLLPYLCYLFYSMFQYSYRTRVNWLLLAFIIFIINYDKFFTLGKSIVLSEKRC